MSIFFTADLHLGHANIIRLCNRPFGNVDEMNNTIINNWNKKVSENDDVYIIGDFMMGLRKNERQEAPEIAKKFITSLSGHKHLIIGNHDTMITRDRKLYTLFDEVVQMKELTVDNTRMVLFHYPMIEWPGYFRNAVLGYGHIHNNKTNNAYHVMSQQKNALNMGVDINNFEPVTLEEAFINNRNFIKQTYI